MVPCRQTMAQTPLTPFHGRRSVVHSLNSMIACSPPLAAMAGHRIHSQGGNAAVCISHASAAALNATEPASTGTGGDMFCLFYDAPTLGMSALNGPGRVPKTITPALREVDTIVWSMWRTALRKR
ncbi:hypothetical protein BO82DRAFT_344612 [Aspergillus uvarum CBS 121591]|uniref:Gamma-glutamyltranspeptidase n=1 Tax=Aspergillus uvarum CBS 121591 TaxID=1448315 RepID=A0A319CG98_9EURO|nr:hypothetical protein BO82DRAFT_344612 [Aspergillus uvarum CBS 121591]PYH77613.1 hypothetical protein BO82DRAFT_344612 [Aspergillus uvarum CBS 121591]